MIFIIAFIHRIVYSRLFDLPSRAGPVVGYGNAGFGKGFHIVEHVQGGVDEFKTEAGDAAASDGHIETQKLRLDMEDVRADSGAESFSVAGDDFRGLAVENDERMIVRSGDDSAEEGGGFRLIFGRDAGEKILRRVAERPVAVQQRLAQRFSLRARRRVEAGFSQGDGEKRQRKR